MRGRPDVGLGNIRISDSSRGYHRSDALTFEYAIAEANPSCGASIGRAVAERHKGEGTLSVATKPFFIITASPAAGKRYGCASAVGSPVAISDYWALTKPEVNLLIAMATVTGFYLGFPGQLVHFPWLLFVHTLLGTLLVASGTAALNQSIERRFDAQMRRTARRPLAAGRLKPSVVFWFGMAITAVGCAYLAVAVNALASALAILTLLSYLLLYTPVKRKTPLCVLVGAFPGAMPPLIGWAAASGRLDLQAWILYAMLFLWQFPHFMAIAWMYREDYDRAGYFVLPRGEVRDWVVSLQTILPLLALFPIDLLAGSRGQPSSVYSVGVLLLNLGFFYYGARFVLHKSSAGARRLLLASIIYLPSIFVLMILLGGSSGHSG